MLKMDNNATSKNIVLYADTGSCGYELSLEIVSLSYFLVGGVKYEF